MKKILVIEDNPDVNENLCEILQLSGYEVSSALNGKAGAELAFSESPDLILCDVMMPHLDGYGVLKILSQNVRTAHIPFIFLTAKSAMKDLRKGMNLGAADYILKPFDAADLIQTITIRLAKNNAAPSTTGMLPSDFTNKMKELKTAWSSKYETRVYPARSEIYAMNHHPRFVYLIIDGVASIHQTNSSGKRLTIQLASKDQIIGGREALENQTYIHDAFALTETTAILIPKTTYAERIQQDDTFSYYCNQQAITALNELSNSLVEMAYSSVRRKVAFGLIKYAKAVTLDFLVDGLKITLPREDLAELVGSAKETVIRTLSDFKSEGLVELNNHEIILKDVDKLKDMPV